MEGTSKNRADYRPVICPVCKKPMRPGYGPCPDCVRRARNLSEEKEAAETALIKSDEVCIKCQSAFAVEGGLCETCLTEKARAEKLKGMRSYPAEGEERYKSVPPAKDKSNYSSMSSDTAENIERCLTCEIPAKYCSGENCVSAYRRWQAHLKSRKRADIYERYEDYYTAGDGGIRE